MNSNRILRVSALLVAIVIALIPLTLVSGCEMELKRVAKKAYNVNLEEPSQARDLAQIVQVFSEQFNANLKGGKRDRVGATRYVYELHFSEGFQVNVSNLVNEKQFVIAVYPGDHPDYNAKIDALLDAIDAAEIEIEERDISR